ncbi:metallophosphoesterase, partial [Mycobacterium kansasii]
APVRFCCRPEATLLTLIASPMGGRDSNRNLGRSQPSISVR